MSPNYIDFFILGFPRSGTSLLRMILNGHPDIKVNPECSFLTYFFPDYRGVSFPLSPSEIELFATKVFHSRKFETWNLSYLELLHHLTINKPQNYGHLCSLIYKLHGKKKEFRFLGDKNNVHIFLTDTLREIFPKSKFVYIIRDPRAVYDSLHSINNENYVTKYKPKSPTGVQDFCNQWKEAYKSLLTSNISTSNRIVIRYEDLVDSPKDLILQILDFIDESLPEKVDGKDFSTLHLSGNDEPLELLAWKKRTLEPISSHSADSWKLNLSKEEIEEIENSIYEMMIHFGYLNKG